MSQPNLITKGESLVLSQQEGGIPDELCVGFNWGAINKSKLLGLVKDNRPVNIDASVAAFGREGKLFDMVYYKRLVSDDHSIRHSGDDRTGDMTGDDGADNEVISIRLKTVSESINAIAIFLNSNFNFSDIPYNHVRLFKREEGMETEYSKINLSDDPYFKKKSSMVFGILKRKGEDWEFNAVGEALENATINETIDHIQRKLVQMEY